MANVEQVVTEASEKLMKVVDAYGPKATELVMETGRIAAIQDLIWGFTFLLSFGVCVWLTALCIKKERPTYDIDLSILLHMAAMFLGVAALGSFIGAMVNLTYTFAWVGLQHPEIYLAAKLLKL